MTNTPQPAVATPQPAVSNLFTEVKMGDLELKNRIVYPAMTRARCAGRVPNAENVKYYAARSSAGMIVTEASAVSSQANGFVDAPGMYTEEQAEGWAKVVQAVHDKGGKIVCQLWHTGRMSHSSFCNGVTPVAPSAIVIPSEVNGVPSLGVQGVDYQWYEHPTPKAMSVEDIEDVVRSFGNAAALAKKAGFDGLEVHAGSGYLLDTFLQSCSNVRDDKYGGSAERRFTILGEVLTAVSASFPLARVGVKITPNNGFNGMGSHDTVDTYMCCAARLDAMGVAYLHVTDGIGQAKMGASWYGRTKSTGCHGYGEPLTLAKLHSVFGGALIGNGGYTAETAAHAIASNEAAAISFGRVYMTNPDLVERFRDDLPLTPLPPTDEWFVPNERLRADVRQGYTKYGSYEADMVPAAPGSPTSIRSTSIYTTHEDVDHDSASGWTSLEELLASDGAVATAAGAAAVYSKHDREAVARKLITNHVRVLQDMTNATARNIDSKSLTQVTLRRIVPQHRPSVDGFLRELTRRLLGASHPTTLVVHLAGNDAAQAAVWVASAAFLEARIQSAAAQCPGRQPDMSPEAAAAMKAVMAELSAEAAALAAHAPSVLLPADLVKAPIPRSLTPMTLPASCGDAMREPVRGHTSTALALAAVTGCLVGVLIGKKVL